MIGRRAFLAVLAAPLVVRAQEPTFTVNVRLVRILATVKNNSGELVGGLDKQDFEIYDNGVKQDLAVFERHTEQPLSVAVLIDTSGSTAIELKFEVDSIHRFARTLIKQGNPADTAALYAFSWETVELAAFTRNLVSLEQALRDLKTGGGTSLYDAICFAADALDEREGRHVMVIVTDGGDTVSARNFHQALEAAQRADAVIYPILVMPITNDAGRNIGGENALAQFASGTAGRVFTPGARAELDDVFSEILRELRTQYLIGYYPKDVPPSKNPFHELEVKLRRNDLRVVARSGYYEESDSAKPAGWRPVR